MSSKGYLFFKKTVEEEKEIAHPHKDPWWSSQQSLCRQDLDTPSWPIEKQGKWHKIDFSSLMLFSG